MKTIYIMLTNTNTVMCKMIQTYTKQPYAHVSILLNDQFKFGYSFSRRKINNPFIGGFMKEDYIKWTNAFPETNCQIYKISIQEEVYREMLKELEEYNAQSHKYRYDFVALVGQAIGINIERKNRYFCSKFVAYILEKYEVLEFNKRQINIRPIDFATHQELDLIYEGELKSIIA